MSKVLALMLTVALAAGCGKRYPMPVVEPATRPFQGLASYFVDTGQTTIHALFVHGMCSHSKEEWVDREWTPAILGALSAQQIGQDKAMTRGLPEPIQIVDKTFRVVGNRTLEARFILWSAATAKDKETLNYDRNTGEEGGDFPLERATVNRRVKAKLINDCFSDAVIYSGRRSTELRTLLKDAICDGFSGCDGNDPLVIITESLGSKMVIDAVEEMSSVQKVGLLAATRQIFMLANQLPLIGLATAPARTGAVDSRVATFASSWREARGRDADLSVVAFTDPNDLLSYRLQPSQFPGSDLHNVMTSNSGTWFGLLEDPDAAHTKYRNNEEVMRLVLCGHLKDDCKRLKTTRGVESRP